MVSNHPHKTPVNRHTINRRTLLGSGTLLGVGALLTACADTKPSYTPDPSASAYRPLNLHLHGVEDMPIIAAVYAQALIAVGYDVIIHTGPYSREEYTRALQNTEESNTEGASLDIVLDLSHDLLLESTQDAKLSPASIASERAAASASASADAAGVSLKPSPSVSMGPSPSASPSPSSAFNIRAMSSSDIINAIKRVLPESISVQDALNASFDEVLTVTSAFSTVSGINSLAQIADYPQAAGLRYELSSSYATSSYGMDAIAKAYKFTTGSVINDSDPAERVNAIISGSAQIAQLRSIDPAISDNLLVTLADPQNIQMRQQLLPLTRAQLPASARETIAKVSATLDNNNITFLLRLTGGANPVSSEDAAKFWLEHPRK